MKRDVIEENHSLIQQSVFDVRNFFSVVATPLLLKKKKKKVPLCCLNSMKCTKYESCALLHKFSNFVHFTQSFTKGVDTYTGTQKRKCVHI